MSTNHWEANAHDLAIVAATDAAPLTNALVRVEPVASMNRCPRLALHDMKKHGQDFRLREPLTA